MHAVGPMLRLTEGHVFLLILTIIAGFFVSGCSQKKQKPNILFAILDDASFQHFGAYGCTWVNTPHIDRLARQGLIFSRAYTPNAKCAPSRSCILTGRNTWQLEEAANHWCFFPQKFKSFAEVLAEYGFHVGYTGKGWGPGISGEFNAIPRQLLGPSYNSKKLISPTSGISSVDYAGNFIDFLNASDQSDPFMFWFGSFEPHRAFEYGSGVQKGHKKLSDLTDRYPLWPENDTILTDLLDYAYEIEYFDQQLGLMVAELEKRSLLDQTLIVVTSDNGMAFPRVKGQCYEWSNHMPLIVSWPGGIKYKGRQIDDFVSFIDFAPTILELAGIDSVQSGMSPMEGKSLLPLFYSKQAGRIDASRDFVLIGKERHDVGRPNDQGYPVRGIVTENFLLLQNFEPTRWPSGDPVTGYLNCDGSPTKTICLRVKADSSTYKYWAWSFGKRNELELYDIKSDPACLYNLSALADYQPILTQLKTKLYTILTGQEDPRMLGRGDIFDQYRYADPSGVNFYERYLNGETLNANWVNPSDFEKQPN